jgi:S-adenosylmethionine-diacylglycerol 3-amino-3-carboxypropyl transferase
MSDRIEERADFGHIRYASVWEDADILVPALCPGPGRRMLSIASGGDNAFALLAEGAEVVAADLSPAQLAIVELKVAAFRELDHNALLAFLGVQAVADRPATFAKLEGQLSDGAREFFRANPEAVADGIIHAGKFERYFHLFRKRVLPLCHSKRRVAALLEPRDREGREAFYTTVWDNWRWRLLFRVFFSRFVMGRLGRDPEFFRYVEGSVADRILSRARHALTVLPTHGNPYLTYILTGNYSADALPRYLRPEYHDAIRSGLSRLTLHHGLIQAAPGGPFDGFNLSDIFEYLNPELCREVYGALLDQAASGARFAYWNMLVPRQCPKELADRVRLQQELSDTLFAQDLAFFYRAFVVEEVV